MTGEGGVGFGSNNCKVRDIVKFQNAFTSSATNVASTFPNADVFGSQPASFSKTCTPDAKIERSPMNCPVPRRLFLVENVRAKEGGKETTGFACCPLPSHCPLRFITNRAPEEEAAPERGLVISQMHFCVGSLARLHALGQQFKFLLLCLLQPVIHSRHHS